MCAARGAADGPGLIKQAKTVPIPMELYTKKYKMPLLTTMVKIGPHRAAHPERFARRRH
jgi:hypothetical protein